MHFKLLLLFIVLSVLGLSGCVTKNYYGTPGGDQQRNAQQAPPQALNSPQSFAPAAGNTPGQGQQPPIGFMTKRTTLTKVSGWKINSWGFPGQPLNPPKAGAIQKWICGGTTVYNVFFEREAEAQGFLSSPNRDQMLSQWRALLDSQQPVPDPSRPGAFQVYITQ
ncbi:MAG: hypothetical protein HGB08_04440 [Candidatus Moranbacteria bacterium]|nr:hypothetical protein [Candidatus Moranbacteria bacterium]